jgi:hypothetical protein
MPCSCSAARTEHHQRGPGHVRPMQGAAPNAHKWQIWRSEHDRPASQPPARTRRYMGAFGPSAHALFVTVGHSWPGRGVKRDGRQASGCRRLPVFGPRAGARAGVTSPGRGAGATAGRAAAANTRATQVPVQEASTRTVNARPTATRQRLVRRLHRVKPLVPCHWRGDTLPARSHNVNGSKTTGERRVPLAARRLKCREFPGNNVETS